MTTTTNRANIDVITEKWIPTTNLEKHGNDVVAYEREPLSMVGFKKGDNAADFIVVELRQVQQRKTYMGLSSSQH